MVPPDSNSPHQYPSQGGAEPPHGGPPPPSQGGAAPPSGPQPWQQNTGPGPGQAAQGGHPGQGGPADQGPYGPPAGYGAPGQPPGQAPGQPPGQPPGQQPYGGYGPPPPGGAPQKRSSGALWWILGAGALVLVLVVAGGGVAAYLLLGDGGSGNGTAVAEDQPGKTEPGDIEGVRTFGDVSREHTEEPVSYDVYPPPGGRHHPVWQNCGVYQQELMPEHAVHSLEHGAVWITYRDELPGDQVAQLEDLYRQGDFLLISPAQSRQQAPIAAVAWGKRLVLEDAEDPRLVEFLNTYVQGPRTPEPGAPCSSGTDATLEAV
ncbi:hypothetical protein GCM10027570_12030 [Streptomonospora sediminis]